MQPIGRTTVNGVLAGMLAGLAGSLATNRFHQLRRALMRGEQEGEGQSYVAHPGRTSGLGEQLSQEAPGQRTNAAVVLAERLARPVLKRSLHGVEREVAGALMHYGFGASAGAVYGAGVALAPRVSIGHGLLFGVGLWAIADEGAVPALGLTRSRRELPAAAHLASLGGHLVFGLVVETTRRMVVARFARREPASES